jgi:hypothetical protein
MKQASDFGLLLLKNLDGMVVPIALVSWQFLTKSPLNIRTALTLCSLLILQNALSRIRAIHASAAPGEPAEKRVFVEDPEAVLELAKLSGYDAIRRFAPYLGKWMTISGTYEGIAKSLLKDSIHLSLPLHDGRRINLRFAVDREEELRGLQIGQRITAIRQIQHLSFTLKPENCELVRAEPLRRAARSMLAHVS